MSPLPCLLLLLGLMYARAQGIPGASATNSGYDREMGKDAICWSSQTAQMNSTVYMSIPFPNPLIQDFRMGGEIQLQRACPTGNTLKAWAPLEYRADERLRTGRYYNYTVQIELDISTLEGGDRIIADEGTLVAIQVINCVLGAAGFCSPFVHEISNERLASKGITQTPATGERHADTHVHSPKVFVELDPAQGPVYSLTVDVPMLINDPGHFFSIAAVNFFVGEENGVEMRWDMANAMVDGQRLLDYQDPPEVLVVEDGVLIFSYALIGLGGSVILVLLYQTVRHYQHQVLRLSQVFYLVILLVSALAAILSSFMLEPKNDTFCQIGKPIVMISLQVMYAVTIGRLWRINSLISPLLMQTLRQKESWMNRFAEFVQKHALCCVKTTPRKFRQQVPSWQVAALMAVITLPQIVLCTLGAVLQSSSYFVQWNEDISSGRASCGVPDRSYGETYYFWALVYLMITMLGLLIMAYATRNLPSLFNETRIIFDSIVFSMVAAVIGIGAIVVTNDPETSPTIEYVAWVALILCMTLNLALRTMVPKLQMVWRNEKILVSKLVADHSNKVREINASYIASSNSRAAHSSATFDDTNFQSGDDPTEGPRPDVDPRTTVHSESQEVLDDFAVVQGRDGVLIQSDLSDCTNDDSPIQRTNSDEDLLEEIADSMQRRDVLRPAVSESHVKGRRRPGKRPEHKRLVRIVVNQEEAPSRRLILRMVHLQEQLSDVNQKIMSGSAVTEEQWEELRRLATDLGITFSKVVTFAWEANEDTSLNDQEQETLLKKEDATRVHFSESS